MHGQIVARLAQVEKETGVRVLFACESGSRIWGFPSKNSDYDVRGIFHYPLDRYLHLQRPPDVISFIDGEMDIHLWDIYKYMQLLQKSNPSTLEWITSPQVYVHEHQFLSRYWTEVVDHHWWSRIKLIHHYKGLAYSEWSKYIVDKEQVKTKAYFYVLRALFTMEWLARFATLPPQHDLLALMTMLSYDDNKLIPQAILGEIAHLIIQKQKGREFDTQKHRPDLDAYITGFFERWNSPQSMWSLRPGEMEREISEQFTTRTNEVIRDILQHDISVASAPSTFPG